MFLSKQNFDFFFWKNVNFFLFLHKNKIAFSFFRRVLRNRVAEIISEVARRFVYQFTQSAFLRKEKNAWLFKNISFPLPQVIHIAAQFDRRQS